VTVTIDELQVEVQSSAPRTNGSAPQRAEPKEPVSLRAEQAKLTERELRLKAD
jgi:hypothetical protein